MKRIWQILTTPFRIILWPFRITWNWLRTITGRAVELLSTEEEDVPVSDTLLKAAGEPSLLLPHIAALRIHLFRSVVVLTLTTVGSFFFAEQILDFLASPVGGIAALESIGVTESIGVFMRVSLLTGFSVALPYLVLEALFFIAPGLKRGERRMGCMAVPVITLLFAAGIAFAIFVALEPALTFLTNFIFATTPRPAEYYPFVTGLMFWTGVIFEIPVIIYLITALGFVRADALMRSSRYVIVGLAVIAAVITPTPDPINMIIILVPLIALYYLGVGFAFLAQRARDRRRSQPSG